MLSSSISFVRRTFLILVIIGVFVWQVGLAAPRMSIDPLPSPTAARNESERACSVNGRITDQISGLGIKGAEVYLKPSNLDSEKPVYFDVTDDEGRFAFSRLSVGDFEITAVHPLYVISVDRNGQDASAGVISLRTTPCTKEVNLKLAESATVRGRVSDTDNHPVYGAVIRFFRTGTVDGDRYLVEVDRTVTNNRGEYRIPSIRAGEYMIQASFRRFYPPPIVPTQLVPSRRAERAIASGYKSSFYPSGTDIQQAKAIMVRVGSDLREIDIKLDPANVCRIHGTILSPPGDAALQASVYLWKMDENGRSAVPPENTQVMDMSRGFDFWDVEPGKYTLAIYALMKTKVQRENWKTIDVVGSNVDIETSLQPPTDLVGTIIASRATGLIAGSVVTLTGRKRGSIQRTTVDDSGSFKIGDLPPDVFKVSVMRDKKELTLKRIRLGDKVVANSQIEVGFGVVRRELVIELD